MVRALIIKQKPRHKSSNIMLEDLLEISRSCSDSHIYPPPKEDENIYGYEDSWYLQAGLPAVVDPGDGAGRHQNTDGYEHPNDFTPGYAGFRAAGCSPSLYVPLLKKLSVELRRKSFERSYRVFFLFNL